MKKKIIFILLYQIRYQINVNNRWSPPVISWIGSYMNIIINNNYELPPLPI